MLKTLRQLATPLRRHLISKSWLADLPLLALAWWAAFWLRFNLTIPQPYFDQAAILALLDREPALVHLERPVG
jgi:hypothetical protein